MIKIDEVIIVEGRNDLSRLKSLVDAEIVTTGGTSMNQDFWNLLSLYNRNGKEFIVMVDPDSQGERIRLAISKFIQKLNIFSFKQAMLVVKTKSELNMLVKKL